MIRMYWSNIDGEHIVTWRGYVARVVPMVGPNRTTFAWYVKAPGHLSPTASGISNSLRSARTRSRAFMLKHHQPPAPMQQQELLT